MENHGTLEPAKPKTEKALGKIESAYFGIQDGKIGLHLSFTFGNRGVVWSEWSWDFNENKWTERCQWTELEREQEMVELMRKISDILRDAKVDRIENLKGKPVELTVMVNSLQSWRILTEVM